jgi:hypothetical protein
MRPALLNNDWINLPTFDPQRTREHVESFFVKANDPVHKRALWVRCTLFSGAAERYAEVWAIWFDPASGKPRAAKNRYPIEAITLDPERGGLGIADASVSDNLTEGAVRGDGFVISWRLALRDEQPGYAGLPARWLYRLVASKLTTPHPSAAVNGEIEIWNGRGRGSSVEKITVENWRGMQGHNWGRRQAESYAWCHCNAFDETGAVFEAITGRNRMAGKLTPPLTVGRITTGGRTYRFDRFRTMRAPLSEASPTRWRFELRGPDGRLTGTAQSRPDDVAGLVYPSPASAPAYCYNSKLATLDLELTAARGGVTRLHSERAALEILQPTRAADIPLVIT